ncbi:MAG: hypothetical protein Q8O67_22740 [Deltaproteobacteria bacterium]|nr:hypothetical protein [Deltaproteobacteria bacterium]
MNQRLFVLLPLALLGCTAPISEGEGETAGEGEGEACTTTEQLEIFERRIEPLVSGTVPSSCQQCHLEGVSLGSYVQDTPCQTMACLVESGEVDLANPNNSPILARILNATPDSALITADVIQQEHDGFLEWITWSSTCQDDVCGEIANPCNAGGGSGPPPDVLSPLGGCDEAQLVSLFDQKVFADRGRCNSCHAVYGEARDDNEDNGTAPLWIFGASNTPAANDARNTMYNVIGLQSLNVDDPAQSRLLLKPLNIETHLGGKKFEDTNDASYQSFLSWIEDYAECIGPQGGEGEGEGEGEGPQAPIVNLSHPGAADGPRPAGQPIPWIGDATDPQDGVLSGASLVWTSDQLAAPFGTGTVFDLELPLGTHLVTLTATDGDGNTGTDTVTVVVQ